MATNFQSEAFVRQYQNTVYMKVKAMGNAFNGTTVEEVQNGELAFYETLGSTSAQVVPSGASGATPFNDITHEKRVCQQTDVDCGLRIAKLDADKALVNFESRYIERIAQAIARKKDQTIITGMLGSATTGRLADGTVAFDYANQTVAVDTGSTGATGFNMDKAVEVEGMFLEAGYTTADKIYIALGGKQIRDIKLDERFISYDYNTMKPLANGAVGEINGMTVVHSQYLPFVNTAGEAELVWNASTDLPVDTDSTETRGCVAWVESGVIVGTNPNMFTRVSERDDYKYDYQAYCAQGVGAVRMDEKSVIFIPCAE